MTDEGFAEFIDDLIQCITYRDSEHPEGAARITELHLQGNKLTVQSLEKLAQVVALSPGDLRELDISRNLIVVKTTEQKAIWQAFLESFKGCYLLRKLDFGHNPLGSWGMEIIARVYMQSELDFLETEAEDVIGTKFEENGVVEDMSNIKLDSGKENRPPASGRNKKQSPSKAKTARQNGEYLAPYSQYRRGLTFASLSGRGNQISGGKPTQEDLKRYSCTRGLRSVPYLILSNIALTNGGAIHLASMITVHRTPEQLLGYLPAGRTPTLPDTEDRCNGLIWFPNETLGQSEHKLLEMAEVVRQHASIPNSDDEVSDDNGESSSAMESTDLPVSTALRQQKKKRDFEYSRISKRVRIDALKIEGVHSSKLWSTALRMMVVTRALLLEDKDRAVNVPPEEIEPEQEQSSEQDMIPEQLAQEESLNSEDVSMSEDCSEWDIPEATPRGPFFPGSQTFEENFPALQASPADFPINPATFQEDHLPRSQEVPTQGASVNEAPTNRIKDKTITSAPRNNSSRPGKAQRPRPPVLTVAKKRSWRYRLPFEFWRKIIADGVGANGILDREQQTLIMRYASDWEAVAYELTTRGALENQQIWKFLETVKCFTYSTLSGDY